MRVLRTSFVLAALASSALPLAHAGEPGAPPRARVPNDARLLAVLGPQAQTFVAPRQSRVGALVQLPDGATASSLGLTPVAPGIARLQGTPADVIAFSAAHPGLRVEVAPPLRLLMDRAGVWTRSRAAHLQGITGQGAYVGVADTGVDVMHAEMRDAAGKTRVAWLLDLSLPPIGMHPELEARFGLKDASGKVVQGAVYSAQDIDNAIARVPVSGPPLRSLPIPTDAIGHGTHVAGIAAATGATNGGRYAGSAPKAGIVFVRITRDDSDGIQNDDLVRSVEFMFDRADADKKPIAVNLSLGTDFGSHDGKMLWEEAVASFVGDDKPGHSIIAAAGNSGSIAESPIHQAVYVAKGARMRVPVRTSGADAGSVQVWVALRPGADIKIGLEGPDEEWISPVVEGEQAGRNREGYNAGVIFGQVGDSPVPKGSRGAVVVWSGRWPSGDYAITLEGEGSADLYLQGVGDAGLGGAKPAYFRSSVREGTVNLPATHPAIIGVGCTVNRTRFVSSRGAEVVLRVPLLDSTGASPISGVRELIDGEVCWFSSAGPTVIGVPKPEISAPGGIVVSSMSRAAAAGEAGSIFTNPSCPKPKGSDENDPRCLQVDATHAVSVGTSMSAPVVAGIVALLFQRDPTLTQSKITALLQGGAHRFRGPSPFEDQNGPGEVDAMGALAALERMQKPENVLPSPGHSWLALSQNYLAADRSTPMTVLVELRTEGGDPADFFDGARVSPVVIIDGLRQPGVRALRRSPGVFAYEFSAPPGLGGRSVTFGAEFDGKGIGQWKTVPIAVDAWSAAYPPKAAGGCIVSRVDNRADGSSLLLIVSATLLLCARARRSR
jgi:subtilisin family serine protease